MKLGGTCTVSGCTEVRRAQSRDGQRRHRLAACTRPNRRNTIYQFDKPHGNAAVLTSFKLLDSGHPVGLSTDQTSNGNLSLDGLLIDLREGQP